MMSAHRRLHLIHAQLAPSQPPRPRAARRGGSGSGSAAGTAAAAPWRIAFGELSQETDTFSPARQDLAAFEANGILSGDELFQIPTTGAGESGTAGQTNTPTQLFVRISLTDCVCLCSALGGFLSVAESFSDRCELVPLIKANGGAGPTISSAVHIDL